ncbi:putative diguanylate cyclase YfiN [compost metagenome]
MKAGKASSLYAELRRGHLSVALIAVSLVSISLTLLGVLALRVYADHNLHLIARSISYTVEAAVVFRDASAASEALSMIASSEEVADAKVFDAHGTLLARWQREEHGVVPRLEMQLARVLLEEPVNLPILHQEQQVGSIEVSGHGASLLRFLLSGLAGILICTVLSAFSALYLSRRLLVGIVGPLRNLATVVHAAMSERAFERRAPAADIDELNDLGNDFNALFDELQVWQSHWQSENESLAHQASHDSLTGLPNRAFFEGRLSRALRAAAKNDDSLAVLYLDSNGFKAINDTHGHAAGDEVLISVATRVRGQLREHDLVARLGGDEFAVLLSPLHEAEDARHIADNIIASMHEPIHLPNGATADTSVSVGIALYPEHGQTPSQLLHVADNAMYQAKRRQRGARQKAEPERSGELAKNRSCTC